MKKISLIFKDDGEADDWLIALSHGLSKTLLDRSRLATIKVSTRKVKKGKAV